MSKIFAAVFAAIFFIANTCAAYAPEGKVFVSMLDIGQGDSFLVETPYQNVLIDTGDVAHRHQLVRKLKEAGISRLERIILSHSHADHIGGVQAVLDNFTVDEICDNGVISTSPLYIAYRSAVDHRDLKYGDILDLGGGVKFKVLHPYAELVRDINCGSQRSNPNNESVVGKLIFGEFSVLFTGDIERDAEDYLVDNHQAELKSLMLKAAHHGSATSNSNEFVASVSPDFVLISAGKANKFGHPHKQSLANFRQNFVLPQHIFCTRFNGDIRIESDGKNNLIIVERDNDWVEDYSRERVTVTRLD